MADRDNIKRVNLFQQYILRNTLYWRNYVDTNKANATVLEKSRNQIIRGLKYALELEATWPLLCELIETFSPHMERGGYWESWHWVLKEAIEMARQVEDLKSLVMLSILLARLLQRQSNLQEAIITYRHAIGMARQNKDRYSEARICSNLAYIYVRKGRWMRAEVLGYYALTIFKGYDDKYGLAHTENHLGILYLHQGDWANAKQHLEQACDLWQAIDDHHGLMRGFINLSMLYNNMKQPENALPYLEKALAQAKQTGEEAEIAKIYLNMGAAYQLLGQAEQAEKYLWLAEPISRRLSDPINLAMVHHNLGIVYTSLEEWPKADAYLQRALNAWRNFNNKAFEAETLLELIAYELARGQGDGATKWLAQLDALINQAEQPKQFAYLQPHLEKYRRDLTKLELGQANTFN